ncbi:MAG: hypothetical protein ABL890_03050 [Candidatus Peribacteraceae bacterium]
MSKPRTVLVPGKIILSGEYAVVFGFPGIAMPSKESLQVTFEEGPVQTIEWRDEWKSYAEKVIGKIGKGGAWTITGDLPIGKGMGASTALVIGCVKAAGGDERMALEIEDEVNPGHSGIDFAVIWGNAPIVFRKDEASKAALLPDAIKDIELIDTGRPEQATPELVAWVKSRKDDPKIAAALHMIGTCTDRILSGEDIKTVIRDHHLAQVALGVVPESVQKIIAEIERGGGAAKVIGAGSRTGGGGMVMALK